MPAAALAGGRRPADPTPSLAQAGRRRRAQWPWIGRGIPPGTASVRCGDECRAPRGASTAKWLETVNRDWIPAAGGGALHAQGPSERAVSPSRHRPLQPGAALVLFVMVSGYSAGPAISEIQPPALTANLQSESSSQPITNPSRRQCLSRNPEPSSSRLMRGDARASRAWLRRGSGDGFGAAAANFTNRQAPGRAKAGHNRSR